MKLYMISVRDRKVEAFMTPFFVTHVGQAVRSFSDEINNPQSQALGKHPEDYSLYQIGVFDDADAKVESEIPRLLAVGSDVLTNK